MVPRGQKTATDAGNTGRAPALAPSSREVPCRPFHGSSRGWIQVLKSSLHLLTAVWLQPQPQLSGAAGRPTVPELPPVISAPSQDRTAFQKVPGKVLGLPRGTNVGQLSIPEIKCCDMGAGTRLCPEIGLGKVPAQSRSAGQTPRTKSLGSGWRSQRQSRCLCQKTSEWVLRSKAHPASLPHAQAAGHSWACTWEAQGRGCPRGQSSAGALQVSAGQPPMPLTLHTADSPLSLPPCPQRPQSLGDHLGKGSCPLCWLLI